MLKEATKNPFFGSVNGVYLGHDTSSIQVSWKPDQQFLRDPADKPTNRQTDKPIQYNQTNTIQSNQYNTIKPIHWWRLNLLHCGIDTVSLYGHVYSKSTVETSLHTQNK